MNYDIYKATRDASWKCLIDCGVSELPIKPVQIVSHYGIECRLTDAFLTSGESGKLIRRASGKMQIVVRPTDTDQRKRFTILHELCHYLLGESEYQAERFAASVLMPACVLWGLNAYTPERISQLCNVSQRAAQRRSERMQFLLQKGKFLVHPLEHQVYAQFKSFIICEKGSSNISDF